MADATTYSAPHRAIHWLTAILIFGMIPVGVYMTNAFGTEFPPERGRLYELHKSFGLVILMLACARVIVRVVNGAPPPEASLTRFQRVASGAVHHLLYVLIFLVPISGWVATSMCCAPVNLFWSVPLTLPVSGSEATAKLIFRFHFAGAALLTLLVLAHVGAALMHLVIIRDGVFRRMWPGRTA